MAINYILIGFGKEYGFSLVEFLVAMGIMVLILSFGLFFSLDSYREYSFRAERDLAVSVLQKARSKSVANVNQQPHGVHVDAAGGKYVIFQGSIYNPSDSENLEFPFIYLAPDHAGMNDVLFNQLDGSVNIPQAWHFSQGLNSSDVTANTEGQISWTN